MIFCLSTCLGHIHWCTHGIRGQLVGSTFTFYYVGPGDLTQAVRLVSKHLYPQSHLASPQNISKQLQLASN